jgi:regulatory protein
MRKMQQWQIEKAEQQKILQQLINQKFIDDARYAKNFARTQSQTGKWGMQKIKAYLQQQRLSNEIIAQALQETDAEKESVILEQLVRKKLPHIKAQSTVERAAKLLRFALGKGYQYTTAVQVIKQALDDDIEY